MNQDYHQITQNILKNSAFLQGQVIAMKEEKEDIFKKVEHSKKWLEKQPDYIKFLQHFQNIFHQKNLGTFNELLTFFVQDILKKDREILLDLYTYHNLPALRIESVNKGEKENIYEGNGGSIANIVSTGLRLIALSRLPHRKFIILDEPDCWLETKHIPLFAQIIGEISQKLKIQTVIISHHSWEYFKNYGRVISLEDEGGLLKSSIIHDVALEEDSPEDYIEKIHLRRFMSHYNTIYELHPYLTCIVGTNDIGKSVIGPALKSLAYADSSDAYIMHHEGDAQVQIDLTLSRTILWERFRQTSQENTQKVKYSLYKEGAIISEYSASEVPKFIQEELNIAMVEDIDVHIGSQKQPVFLLSPDIKPQEKAKILSLGKESLIIQKMMENLKEKTKEHRKNSKDGEIKYSDLSQKLNALSNVDDFVNQAEALKTELYTLDKSKESIENLKSHIEKMERVHMLAHLKSLSQISYPDNLNQTEEINEVIVEMTKYHTIENLVPVNFNIVEPSISNTQDLLEIIKRLSYHRCIAQVDASNLMNVDIDIQNTDALISLIVQIDKYNTIKSLDKLKTISCDFNYQKNDEINSVIEHLNLHQSTLEDLNQKQKNIKHWETIIEQETEKYLGQINNICPTCFQGITKSHIHGEKNND